MFENNSEITIDTIFSTQNIIIYLIIINILGFLLMFIDKQKAKKVHGEFLKRHYL